MRGATACRRAIRPASLVAATCALILTLAAPAGAWVPQTLDFVRGRAVVAHWPDSAFPIEIEVTRGLSSDIAGNRERSALEDAMATWSAATDSNAALVLARESRVQAGVNDGINAIEFSDDAALQGAGFVFLTTMLTSADGTILEADILVNDRMFGFALGESNEALDFETAVLRELGVFLGLDSSPLGGFDDSGDLGADTAIMYPFQREPGVLARELRHDDIAAISWMYPASGSTRGTLRGTVLRAGEPVFGAHVVAFEPFTQVLVGAVSLPDGSFDLGGLPAGRYLVQALPLGSPAGPQTLGGIFALSTIDTSYRGAFLDRTVQLGAGATVSGLNLEVK